MLSKWPKVYLPGTMLRRLTRPLPREPVRFRGKVKLHGTNSSIHLVDGGYQIQSRQRIIGKTPSGWADNHGFARWATDHGVAEMLAERASLLGLPPTTIFGEWVGKGINDGTACNQLSARKWMIFGIRVELESGPVIVADPESMLIINGLPDVSVIPWHEFDETVSMLNGSELTASFQRAQDAADSIGHRCPLTSSLGADGPGEGLVVFALDANGYMVPGISYKVKAESFSSESSRKTRQARPGDSCSSASVDQFVSSVMTPERIAQGWASVTEHCQDTGHNPLQGFPGEGGGPMRWMSTLMQWFKADILAEHSHEMLDAGIAWKNVSKRVGGIVRQWIKGQG